MGFGQQPLPPLTLTTPICMMASASFSLGHNPSVLWFLGYGLNKSSFRWLASPGLELASPGLGSMASVTLEWQTERAANGLAARLLFLLGPELCPASTRQKGHFQPCK